VWLARRLSGGGQHAIVRGLNLSGWGEFAMPLIYVGSIIVFVLIATATFALVVRRMASRGLDVLVSCETITKGGKSLVVLVHGTRGVDTYLHCMHSILALKRPEADILPVQYPAGVLSNADPFLIAEQICQRIQEAQDTGHYDNITLVGYSKGALLIRKAFVYGFGRIEDLSYVKGESRDPLSWVAKVDRIVLLAGLNRGWTLRRRPKQMPFSRYWLFRFANQLCRLFGVGQLMRHCESGEPFVANLRIQWLELMRGIAKDERPTVIQLLGDKDDLVSSEDQRDVNVARDFIWVHVNNTGHGNIIDLADPVSGAERRSKIAKALGGSADVDLLRRWSSKLPDNQDPLVHQVVVVLHGIRDMAAWTSQFETPLQLAYQAANPGENSKVRIVWPSYGYFGMGPFLLWGDRQANVRWFMDEFTDIKAQYPNLKKVHFIGHSNGTYVLASALQNYRTLKVGNIAFGGCVLRRDYDWDSVASQFDKVRNYVGARDWVVGWFPRLFEYPLFGFVNADLGSAGFCGFTTSRGNDLETRYLNGAHSVALDPRNMSSVVRFIIGQEKIDEPALSVLSPTWKMEYSSKFCWIIWLLILGFVGGLFYGWWALFAWLTPPELHPLHTALAAATFAVLVVAVLKNI